MKTGLIGAVVSVGVVSVVTDAGAAQETPVDGVVLRSTVDATQCARLTWAGEQFTLALEAVPCGGSDDGNPDGGPSDPPIDPVPTSHVRMLFFSQSAQALFDTQTHDVNVQTDRTDILGPRVEYMWQSGGSTWGWSRPDLYPYYWQNPLQRPVDDVDDTAVTEVVFFSTQDAYLDDPVRLDLYRRDLRVLMDVIRERFPEAERIWVSPVIDGPVSEACYWNGERVRADINSEYIAAELAVLAAEDPMVRAGATFRLESCDGYTDRMGHINGPAEHQVGLDIATYYRSVLFP
jgi:hypothetical protein